MTEILSLSLGLTLLIELAVSLLSGLRRWDLLLVAAVNLLTNPLVVLWHYCTAASGVWIATVLPELAAVTVEALLFRKLGSQIRRPVLLSVCINLVSYGSGALISLLWR